MRARLARPGVDLELDQGRPVVAHDVTRDDRAVGAVADQGCVGRHAVAAERRGVADRLDQVGLALPVGPDSAVTPASSGSSTVAYDRKSTSERWATYTWLRRRSAGEADRHEQVAVGLVARSPASAPHVAGEPVRTAGLVDVVNDSRTTGESDRAQPVEQELRVERDARSASPSSERPSASEACASSPVPASSWSSPAPKDSRTGVLRSATSATRLTASTSARGVDDGDARDSAGSSERYLGNSPSSSRGRGAPAGALEADQALAGAAVAARR